MKDVFDQQTLELTLKASNEGIWDWDILSDQIYYSERIIEFLGFEELTPPNIMIHPERVVHDEYVQAFKETLTNAINDPNTEHLAYDCKIIRPDGQSRWIRIRGIIIKENERAIRIVGSMIDISLRKFTEEMMEEEQSMLRLIIDNIPLQVYFKDTESRYKLVNQRQIDWLGKHQSDEVLGKSGESFFSPQSWSATRQEELHMMDTGTSVIDAIQREQWPNKDDTYIQKVKHPWYDRSNNLLGTYGISCDVTNLIEAKKKLESLAISLQQKNKNYQQELMLATEVQRAILPENAPDWNTTLSTWDPFVEISTVYDSASELAGDFYDIIPISDTQIGFIIIDVMGHGVRSAIIISLIKGLMEKTEHLAALPARYLEEINYGLTTILHKADITLFASACYVLLDFEAGKLITANAGHDLPLIKFASQSSENQSKQSTDYRGSALGIRQDADFPETHYPLDKIDSILLYTDGIYEVSNKDGEEWGLGQLQKTFNAISASNLDKSPPQKIYQKASEWLGHDDFQDDVCLLNLKIV